MQDGMSYPLSAVVLRGSGSAIAQAKAAAKAQGIGANIESGDGTELWLSPPSGQLQPLALFLKRVQDGEFGEIKIGLATSPRGVT
ncbi:MAG: hypothetical protein AB7O49_07635 [Sphingomonadales bacterium]